MSDTLEEFEFGRTVVAQDIEVEAEPGIGAGVEPGSKSEVVPGTGWRVGEDIAVGEVVDIAAVVVGDTGVVAGTGI